MKFFIGRVSPSLTKNDLKDYFSKFGKIVHLNVFTKDKYAFVDFQEPFNINFLLSIKEHVINNTNVIVEVSRDNYRSQNRFYSEERGRYDYGGRGMDGYMYNNRMNYSPYEQGWNIDSLHWKCSYCSKCPRHGANPIREVPNAHLKMICDGIDARVTEKDLRSFCEQYNVKPVFFKISGTAGIIELQTISDRDEAFKILDGKYLTLNPESDKPVKYQITTKTYIRKADAYKENENRRKRYKEQTAQEGSNYCKDYKDEFNNETNEYSKEALENNYYN